MVGGRRRSEMMHILAFGQIGSTQRQRGLVPPKKLMGANLLASWKVVIKVHCTEPGTPGMRCGKRPRPPDRMGAVAPDFFLFRLLVCLVTRHILPRFGSPDELGTELLCSPPKERAGGTVPGVARVRRKRGVNPCGRPMH